MQILREDGMKKVRVDLQGLIIRKFVQNYQNKEGGSHFCSRSLCMTGISQYCTGYKISTRKRSTLDS